MVEDDLEPLRPRHHIEVDVDADLARTSREHLREQQAGGTTRGNVQRRAEALRVGRLRQLGLRVGDAVVVGLHLLQRRVDLRRREQPLEEDERRQAGEHLAAARRESLVDVGLVEGIGDRPPDVDVLERAVLDVDRESTPATRDVGADLHVRRLRPRRDRVVRHREGPVDLAALEREQPGLLIGNDREHDLVPRILLPLVIGVADENDP